MRDERRLPLHEVVYKTTSVYSMIDDLGFRHREKFVGNMKKVAPEDVKRVAQQYIKDIQFVVIGDPAKIDQKVFISN